MLAMQNTKVEYQGWESEPPTANPEYVAYKEVKMVPGHTLCLFRVDQETGKRRLLDKLTLTHAEIVNSKVRWEMTTQTGGVIEGSVSSTRHRCVAISLAAPLRVLIHRHGLRWVFNVRVYDPSCRVLLLPDYEKLEAA